jgi:hypothetical protein
MRLSLLELALLLAAGVVIVLSVPRCSGGGGGSKSVVRASWGLTPGALNPDVMQSTIAATICKRGWTRTIRPPVSYTNDLKRKGLRQYGLRGPPSDYQEDHLISLELGGSSAAAASRSPRDSAASPRSSTRTADRVTNRLRRVISR